MSEPVTSRDIEHLKELIETGFSRMESRQDETNVCLQRLNGQVKSNTVELVRQETRITALERFRDVATKALLSGLGFGIGAAATVGGIIFGIGKAVGWW